MLAQTEEGHGMTRISFISFNKHTHAYNIQHGAPAASNRGPTVRKSADSASSNISQLCIHSGYMTPGKDLGLRFGKHSQPWQIFCSQESGSVEIVLSEGLFHHLICTIVSLIQPIRSIRRTKKRIVGSAKHPSNHLMVLRQETKSCLL